MLCQQATHIHHAHSAVHVVHNTLTGQRQRISSAALLLCMCNGTLLRMLCSSRMLHVPPLAVDAYAQRWSATWCTMPLYMLLTGTLRLCTSIYRCYEPVVEDV